MSVIDVSSEEVQVVVSEYLPYFVRDQLQPCELSCNDHLVTLDGNFTFELHDIQSVVVQVSKLEEYEMMWSALMNVRKVYTAMRDFCAAYNVPMANVIKSIEPHTKDLQYRISNYAASDASRKLQYPLNLCAKKSSLEDFVHAQLLDFRTNFISPGEHCLYFQVAQVCEFMPCLDVSSGYNVMVKVGKRGFAQLWDALHNFRHALHNLRTEHQKSHAKTGRLHKYYCGADFKELYIYAEYCRKSLQQAMDEYAELNE